MWKTKYENKTVGESESADIETFTDISANMTIELQKCVSNEIGWELVQTMEFMQNVTQQFCTCNSFPLQRDEIK